VRRYSRAADSDSCRVPPTRRSLFGIESPTRQCDAHPFYSEKPPAGFPTFGEYVDELLPETPGLKSALLRPTHDQINDYMKYMVELAVIMAGGRVIVKSAATAVVVRVITSWTPRPARCTRSAARTSSRCPRHE
jgi:hypothetical protein